MPFERPTLEQLVSRTQRDIQASLRGSTPQLRRTPEGALARAQAGLAHGLYGYLAWLSRQVLPDTADEEYALRWLALFGIELRPATHARGLVRFSGSVDIPAGVAVSRADGVRYTTTALASPLEGIVEVEVLADEPGIAGLAEANTTLRLVSPIAGVTASGSVLAPGLTGGFDRETVESAVQRLVEQLRDPPLGGGPNDYVRWAMEVPGVTRAWQYDLHMGPGTVGLTFVLDELEDIIPGEALVDQVAAYVAARRPVTAEVFVFAPVAVPLDLDLRISPDTTALRDRVAAEVRGLIRRRAEPGGTILLSGLRGAIGNTPGVEDYELLSPGVNVTTPAGHITVPGEITWEEEQ